MTLVYMIRQVLAHPLDYFQDIQQPNRLKWSYGFLLVFIAFLARMGSLLLLGYHYETREAYEISYAYEFVWILVPWLTWSAANWSVSTILEGEGKFKEILVGSAFCLVPYIVLIIPVTLLTNVLSLSEGNLYSLMTTLIFGWVALLLLIKLKVLHDFELGKLVFITLLTLLAMAVIWFIGILLYGLLSQFLSFFFDVFKEIRFRL
ncbi:YIP1 family protein [Paenibacillus arenilitoris]|uniref:YIP1 family protein n=1 Tax=Paenibacillus arenilitoris TaxID=2772299 RepID=A0A927CJK9_9BACL|nr:YIP1 family protein [Paenibacillus arenilitoris]MBD2867803.1 YIP1 family protein [Paenibacillus arenilitoris]